MTKFKRRTVLITGSAAGIGRLMVTECLHLGARQVILWDINEEGLASVKATLSDQGYDVLTDVVDMSQPQQIPAQLEAAGRTRVPVCWGTAPSSRFLLLTPITFKGVRLFFRLL